FGPCNHSDNPTFRDIASSALTRRAAIGAGTGALAIALAGTLGACSGGPSGSRAAAPDEGSASGDQDPAPNGTALAVAAIAPADAETDEFTVAEGFTWAPVTRWGDPLFDAAPEFDWNAQSAEAQERQFGYNNDYTEIQEIPDSDG